MSTTRKSLLAGAAIIISSTFGGWMAQQSGHVSAAVQIPAGYVALNPGRIYDSRGPTFTNPRLGGGAQVTINSGQPGASAVGVNIVMTDTIGPGFLTAWPSGGRPQTSVMNSTVAGENVANFLLVPVAPDGTFQLFTQNPTHVVVDIMGYMAGGSALAPAGFSGQITGYAPDSPSPDFRQCHKRNVGNRQHPRRRWLPKRHRADRYLIQRPGRGNPWLVGPVRRRVHHRSDSQFHSGLTNRLQLIGDRDDRYAAA